MSGGRRKKKATGMNNKAKVFIAQGHKLWMERGGWIGGADGQEKGDGSGQKASGIGCRGDEKRMPNHSRPFGLAGPFPPAPLPLPLGRMALQRRPVRVPESQRAGSQFSQCSHSSGVWTNTLTTRKVALSKLPADLVCRRLSSGAHDCLALEEVMVVAIPMDPAWPVGGTAWPLRIPAQFVLPTMGLTWHPAPCSRFLVLGETVNPC